MHARPFQFGHHRRRYHLRPSGIDGGSIYATPIWITAFDDITNLEPTLEVTKNVEIPGEDYDSTRLC